MNEPLFYSLQKAAWATGMSEARLRKHIKGGVLPAQKDGKRVYVDRADLVRLIKSLPTMGREPANGLL